MRKALILMPTKRRSLPPGWTDADPPEPDESAFAERVRQLQPDDPGFDAWLKQRHGGINPYLEKRKVKVRRGSRRPRRS